MGSARTTEHGAVAQLGEHLVCNQGVVGSIPSSSTNLGYVKSRVMNADGVCIHDSS